jgi:hypothetical protein
MGPAWMLGKGRASLQEVLPRLHKHQRNALLDAVTAMIAAGHCQVTRMACAMRRAARVPSSERRLQRLLANSRLDVNRVMHSLAHAVLADAGDLILILDETAHANHLRAMKLCREMYGRALPLLWYCYLPKAPPLRMDQLIVDLLGRAQALLPKGKVPTLLADRGLSWPVVVDFCTAAGWHFVFRIQHHTRLRLDDGRTLTAGQLVRKRGEYRSVTAEVFKKANWRRVNVVVYWGYRHKEPWLLITNLSASASAICAQYAKRMRVEHGFRDEKSHGLHWNQSRVRDPKHAHCLLLLIALALRALALIGQALIDLGHRTYFERRDRRTLSVTQLALRYLHSPLIAFPLRL